MKGNNQKMAMKINETTVNVRRNQSGRENMRKSFLLPQEKTGNEFKVVVFRICGNENYIQDIQT